LAHAADDHCGYRWGEQSIHMATVTCARALAFAPIAKGSAQIAVN
jgi:hypothetical protein